MIPLVMLISVLSLAFAVYLAREVLAADEGTPQMQEIAGAIKEGAEAFLRRQITTIFLIGMGVAAIIFLLYALARPVTSHDPTSSFNMALATTLAFCFGAPCSGVSGYVGMFVAVRASLRRAWAVRPSLNRALQLALRGGAVSGLFVVAMSLLGVGGLFVGLRAFGVAEEKIPLLIVGYGFGASLVALFAQLGGGIYTKAADVGADLVGKVEAGIPEDDPRNPAVIADLVGDNVGDCAGRGADPFESTAAQNIGAMILGSGLALAHTALSNRSLPPPSPVRRRTSSPASPWRSSAPRCRRSRSRPPSSLPTSSALRAGWPTRACSARRWPRWGCWARRRTSLRWTPSAR